MFLINLLAPTLSLVVVFGTVSMALNKVTFYCIDMILLKWFLVSRDLTSVSDHCSAIHVPSSPLITNTGEWHNKLLRLSRAVPDDDSPPDSRLSAEQLEPAGRPLPSRLWPRVVQAL